MSAPIIPTETYTALTHVQQHLRHALRLITRTDLITTGDPESPATQRCAVLCADIAAAARGCANLLDHLDGFYVPEIDEAKQRHPAGSAR